MAYEPESIWGTAFLPHIPWPGLPSLRRVACQQVSDAAYHIVPRLGQDFAVFQYTLAGRGMFHDGSGDRSLPVGCGFLCHASDPVVHYRYPPRAQEPWRFVYASWYCERRTIEALCGDSPIFHLATDHPLIRSLLSFAEVHESRLPAARLVELATRMLVSLGSQRPLLSEQPPSNLRDRIRDLWDSTDRSLDINALAGRLGCSREHLSRQYQRTYGQTLQAQLLRWRLERATDLLRGNTDDDIASIAARAGFSDSGHLARHFKQLHGLTPSRYRALVRSGGDV